MEWLLRYDKVWKEDLHKVEDPFLAKSIVRDNLQSRNYVREINGVTDLLRSCSLYTSRSLTGDEIAIVLRPVESGEWMLLKDEPFCPIDPEEYWYARVCRSTDGDGYSNYLGEGSIGPGKWIIINIEINKLSSAVAFVGNFLISRGDEGRLFLSSGSDYANTTRTVTQKWVSLESQDRDFASISTIHRYGLEHKTIQIYVEADDHWDISGASWHWRPVIANEEYEFKDK